MTRHQLTEHQPKRVQLPVSVANALVADYRGRLDVRLDPEPGHWTLVPNSYVGTIRIDDHEFLIRPKISMANLLALMDIEIASESWGRTVVGLKRDPDLLAVMARLFCVACEQTTRRGVRHSYVAHHEELVAPRGRIDVRALATNPGMVSPVPCRFDEHTANNRLNQLLRAGLRRARRVSVLEASWQRRLLQQLAALDMVDDVADDWSWVTRWEPTPMEQHYSTAARLAHMLLTGGSLRTQYGEADAHTFLLNMNSLFEAWVGRRLAESCDGYQVVEQETTYLDLDGHVRMYPDILVRSHAGDVVAVADCKYKRLIDGEGRSPDYYQALAYATACGLDRAWLVYAREPGDAHVKEITVRNVGARLNTFGIDLSGPIGESERQVDALGKRMLASASLGTMASV